MCGILLILEPGASAGEQIEYYEAGLKARGPDHFGVVRVNVPSAATSHGNSSSNIGSTATACCMSLHMAASLLQLRGDSPSTSPLQDSDGNILCFNGEIFAGLDIPAGGNDGKALLTALQQATATTGAALTAKSNSLSAQCTAEAVGSVDVSVPAAAAGNASTEAALSQTGPQATIPDSSDHSSTAAAAGVGARAEAAAGVIGVLSKLRGPWSLIYWQKQQQRLWFGRDLVGKRSLLLQVTQQEGQPACLVLTSITPRQQQQQPRSAEQPLKWIEVPPGVYSISTADLQSCVGLGHHTTCNTGNTCRLLSSGVNPVSAADCGSPRTAATAAAGTFLSAHLRPVGAVGSSTAAASACAGSAATVDQQPNAGVSTASDLCALLPGLQHHQWQDMQLLQLQPYSRSSRVASTAAQAEAELSGRQHSNGLDVASQQLLVGVESTAAEAEAGLSGRQHSIGLEAAAHELLIAMQAAVDVRCLTINTLQQQCQQQYQQQCQEQQQQQHGQEQQQQQHVQQQQPQGSSQLSASRDGNATHSTLPPASVLILFSGGVDSTLIAALAHNALQPGVPIDLSNVCFDSGRSADRAAARSAVLELAAYAPDRPWRLIEVDSSLQEVDHLAQHIRSLLLPAATVMDWNIGSALWLAARAEGQVWVPVRQTGPPQQGQRQEHGQQQLEQQQDVVEQMSMQEAAPGAAAHSWQLVALGSCGNVSHTAAAEAETQPSQGTQPSQQQQQQQYQQQQHQQKEVPGSSMYRSAARVVLLGHGADEQCGGYGRHRTKFREAGWQGVADELALDVNRLWLRNLGRDDRLVADHGREGRHPFLDENVMSVLQQMPLQLMVDYSKPPGEGDKRILRHLLASLGLPEAAGREKRAIQFGSRIGQLSNKRDFGSNRQANKRQAGSLKVAVASAQQVSSMCSRTDSAGHAVG